jgi:hypothetical protein
MFFWGHFIESTPAAFSLERVIVGRELIPSAQSPSKIPAVPLYPENIKVCQAILHIPTWAIDN